MIEQRPGVAAHSDVKERGREQGRRSMSPWLKWELLAF